MNFRAMKPEDFEVVMAHALYPNDEKKELPDRIDFDYVLEHGDFILAAGGFRMITHSCAWGWIQLTGYVGDHLLPTYRCIKEWMEKWCQVQEVVRLQAWVDVSFEEGKRTVEHLGFQKEFKMINFLGNGKDAWMYVKMMEIG